MKSLKTLQNEVKTITNEELAAIINNEDVDVEPLSEHEKLSVLIYRELAKALNTKNRELVLDCNYSNSKNTYLKVDYFRLAVYNVMIQIYCNKKSFMICTSCSKANREILEERAEELKFTIKRDKKTGRAKTAERRNISYEEVVNVVKSLISIFEITATAKKEKTEKNKPAEAEAKKTEA